MPFQKGRKKTGGRKKGVTNKAVTDIKALAQEYGAAAIQTLVDLMIAADFEPTRVAAAKELLDRGYGKAAQVIDASVTQTIRYEVELAFGQPTQALQSEDALPAGVPGPARNGKALVHNGSAS
jgi:hypothetical protein